MKRRKSFKKYSYKHYQYNEVLSFYIGRGKSYSVKKILKIFLKEYNHDEMALDCPNINPKINTDLKLHFMLVWLVNPQLLIGAINYNTIKKAYIILIKLAVQRIKDIMYLKIICLIKLNMENILDNIKIDFDDFDKYYKFRLALRNCLWNATPEILSRITSLYKLFVKEALKQKMIVEHWHKVVEFSMIAEKINRENFLYKKNRITFKYKDFLDAYIISRGEYPKFKKYLLMLIKYK